MMANFDAICLWVLRQEDSTLSGVVKNLGDGGGLTRYGIAQTKHEALPPDFYVAAPATALTYAKVIYKGEYWDRFLGDEIGSDDVASCLLSFAINDGEAREVIMLQKIVVPAIKPDGVMGPITLAATNAANPALLASTLRTEQGNFYQNLAKTRPDIARELPGLMARAHRMYPSLA
jgi:lysozyme family protein